MLVVHLTQQFHLLGQVLVHKRGKQYIFSLIKVLHVRNVVSSTNYTCRAETVICLMDLSTRNRQENLLIQLLQCEDWLIFSVVHHCKLNISGFLAVGQSKQDNWRCHVGLHEDIKYCIEKKERRWHIMFHTLLHLVLCPRLIHVITK